MQNVDCARDEANCPSSVSLPGGIVDISSEVPPFPRSTFRPPTNSFLSVIKSPFLHFSKWSPSNINISVSAEWMWIIKRKGSGTCSWEEEGSQRDAHTNRKTCGSAQISEKMRISFWAFFFYFLWSPTHPKYKKKLLSCMMGNAWQESWWLLFEREVGASQRSALKLNSVCFFISCHYYFIFLNGMFEVASTAKWLASKSHS